MKTPKLVDIKERTQSFLKNKIIGQSFLSDETKEKIQELLSQNIMRIHDIDGSSIYPFPESLSNAYDNLTQVISPRKLAVKNELLYPVAKTYFVDKGNESLEDVLDAYQKLFNSSKEHQTIYSKREYTDILLYIIDSNLVQNKLKEKTAKIILNDVLGATLLSLEQLNSMTESSSTDKEYKRCIYSLHRLTEDIKEKSIYKKLFLSCNDGNLNKNTDTKELLKNIKEELAKYKFETKSSAVRNKHKMINESIDTVLQNTENRDKYQQNISNAKTRINNWSKASLKPAMFSLATGVTMLAGSQAADSSLGSSFEIICPSKLPVHEQVTDSRVIKKHPIHISRSSFEWNRFIPARDNTKAIAELLKEDPYKNDTLAFLENIYQNSNDPVKVKKAELLLKYLSEAGLDRKTITDEESISREASELEDPQFQEILSTLAKLVKDPSSLNRNDLMEFKHNMRLNLGAEQNYDNFYTKKQEFIKLQNFLREFVPDKDKSSYHINFLLQTTIDEFYRHHGGKKQLKANIESLQSFVQKYTEERPEWQTLINLSELTKKTFENKKHSAAERQKLRYLTDYIRSKALKRTYSETFYDYITNLVASKNFVDSFIQFKGLTDNSLLEMMEEDYSLRENKESGREYNDRLASNDIQNIFLDLENKLSNDFNLERRNNLSLVEFSDSFDYGPQQQWTSLGAKATQSLYKIQSKDACDYKDTTWALDIKVPKKEAISSNLLRELGDKLEVHLDTYNEELRTKYQDLEVIPQFEHNYETEEDKDFYIIRVTLSRDVH